MKPQTKIATLVSIAVLAVGVVFFTTNATRVSASQILDRAQAAQAAAASVSGILHTVIEEYKNPQFLEGQGVGRTTIDETYYDGETGRLRSVKRDEEGNIVEIIALDGSTSYLYQRQSEEATISDVHLPGSENSVSVARFTAKSTDDGESPEDAGEVKVAIDDGAGVSAYEGQETGDAVVVQRIPLERKPSAKGEASNPGDMARSLFEDFRQKPSVKLEGTIPWEGGRQAYVLVNENIETRKLTNGGSEKARIGQTKMAFDTQTYALLEIETSVVRNAKDIVIQRVRFLLDEVLPAEAKVAWDLSDLKGITFSDAQPIEVEESIPAPISAEELARHPGVYVLKTLPDGYTQEIFAAADQPEDEPYAYEIHYHGPRGEDFSLQAVGELTENFIAESFYEASYRTASGLVLHYSPSSSEERTSGMLSTPEGLNFLLFANLPREKVEHLAEDLVAMKQP